MPEGGWHLPPPWHCHGILSPLVPPQDLSLLALPWDFSHRGTAVGFLSLQYHCGTFSPGAAMGFFPSQNHYGTFPLPVPPQDLSHCGSSSHIAQMMPAGAKTGVTQSVSAISQPQDRGVQRLSRSSSAWDGFPWKSWTAFLQVETPQGEPGEGAAPWEWDGPREGDTPALSCPPEQQPDLSWLSFL